MVAGGACPAPTSPLPVGASIARPCPFALQENHPGKRIAAPSWRATTGRPYTFNRPTCDFWTHKKPQIPEYLRLCIEVTGLEPAASWSQTY